MRSLKQSLPGALCALTVLAVLAGACNKDEGRQVLFEEDGTWSLFLFDIDGKGLTAFDASSRVDKFLLRFDMEAGVVAAASCLDSMGRTDLTQALCDTGDFQCRCFDYTYEESTMVWTDRAGGETPAEPGSTVIQLEPYAEYKSTFRFEPLPAGLFNSDGSSARYVFQARGNAQFMPTGCLEACGIAQTQTEE